MSLQNYANRMVILDTETTGLRVDDGNRILEIAAVEMLNRKVSAPERHLHCYINPERDSEEGALNVHGLTPEFLADKPKFAEIVREFLEFVRDAELIIHNAPFDVGFLDAELGRLGLGKLSDYVSNVVDTLKMAKEQFPGKRNSLDALCDRFEIDRTGRVLHGALIDCELLAEVYLSLTRGQDSLLIDFGTDSGVDTVRTHFVRSKGALKVAMPTEDEMLEHQAYLDVLDRNVKGLCLWHAIESAPAAEVGT